MMTNAAPFFTRAEEATMSTATDTTLMALDSALRQKLFPPLTKSDRCDGCGAEAKAQAIAPVTNTRLLFCGHHFRKARKAMDAKGMPYDDSAVEEAGRTEYTWATHDLPWENQFRDAGSAAG